MNLPPRTLGVLLGLNDLSSNQNRDFEQKATFKSQSCDLNIRLETNEVPCRIQVPTLGPASHETCMVNE